MKKVIVIVSVFALFSCGFRKEMSINHEINKGDTFDVILKSNPSTGYTWKWIKKLPVTIIDSVSKAYIQDKAEPDMVGVGGHEYWKFKGRETGIDTLTFEYCRPWEKNSTVETKKIRVKVR